MFYPNPCLFSGCSSAVQSLGAGFCLLSLCAGGVYCWAKPICVSILFLSLLLVASLKAPAHKFGSDAVLHSWSRNPLVVGHEILRCEEVRSCPPMLLLVGVFISVTWLPDFSTSCMMRLFIWIWVMKLPLVNRKCVSFLSLPVLLFVLVCVCYLVLSCCGVIV
jgi:hypothetical protein